MIPLLPLLCVLLAHAGSLQALHEAEARRGAPAALVEAAPDGAAGALAIALGRLRDPAALEPLWALRDDADPAVARAVARALAWTPGAAPHLRAWLDELPPTPPRRPTRHGLRGILLASLGHHAEPADVDRLEGALAGAAPEARAAAISLGRLGRAGVDEAARATPALVAALGRPEVAEAAAFALYRIDDAEVAGDVALVAEHLPSGPGRAWAFRAALPHLEPAARVGLIREALEDPAPVVRVAALQAVQAGDPVALVPLLEAPHPWVRSAAVAAAGRQGGDEAVAALRQHGGDDPWRRAEAVAALAVAGHAPPLEPGQPVPVRAAIAGSLADPTQLVALATGAEEPLVRTSAAGALMRLEEPPPGAAGALLDARDPAIREAGIALLETAPAGVALPLLQQRADVEEDPAVRAALSRALVEHGGEAIATDPSHPAIDLEAVAAVRSATVVTDQGRFRITLLPAVAPVAVGSFARLAEQGFFDGLLFHRVVPAFVVQGGDPRGDGWGGPGYTIPDEVSAIPYDPGAVGMARAERDTGGSQWFVTLTPQPHLVGDYTLFGRVSEGMQVVKRLQRGDRIESVTIERVP